MTRAAPTTAEPTQPDPQQDRPILYIPPYLASVLHVVRVLLAYGRRLNETAYPRSRHIQFATVAAAFGTDKLDTILRRLQRGILRAIALERYLIERAGRRRDLAIVKRRNTRPPGAPQNTTRTPTRPPRTEPGPLWPSDIDPDHPFAFHQYTMEEIEAQVRRRPIGRTIVDICNDLGVTPSLCDGQFWSDVYNAIWCYGGSFNVMFEVQKRRRTAWEKQCDRRQDLQDSIWDWRDTREHAARRAIGCLIGEPPDLPPATVPPPPNARASPRGPNLGWGRPRSPPEAISYRPPRVGGIARAASAEPSRNGRQSSRY